MYHFSEETNKFPQYLSHLRLGGEFNQPINNPPKSLKSIKYYWDLTPKHLQ